MAYDEHQANAMRSYLLGRDGISEKKMFGGLCFLLDGNMVCGVHKGGGMFRVGKVEEATALAVPGTRPLSFTGRKMGGFVEVDEDVLEDDARLQRLMGLAVAYAVGLPPK